MDRLYMSRTSRDLWPRIHSRLGARLDGVLTLYIQRNSSDPRVIQLKQCLERYSDALQSVKSVVQDFPAEELEAIGFLEKLKEELSLHGKDS